MYVGENVSLASEFSDDLNARRARVMERLGPNAVMIFWSAPPARYSQDVDYEYRQDSNLYYLTGVEQEQTILVLLYVKHLQGAEIGRLLGVSESRVSQILSSIRRTLKEHIESYDSIGTLRRAA